MVVTAVAETGIGGGVSGRGGTGGGGGCMVLVMLMNRHAGDAVVGVQHVVLPSHP